MRYALLLGALSLAACDSAGSGSPSETVLFEVRPAPGATATRASVSADGVALGTVDLPWQQERPAASGPFTLAATAADGFLEASVSVGQTVRKRATGRSVAFYGDPEGDEVEVEGRVEAVDLGADTFEIAGIVFGVTAATEFDDEDLAALSDLYVGDPLEVEARRRADGSLLALEVEREDEGDEGGEVEVEGVIEALDASAGVLTVAGLSFAVTGDTELDYDGALDTLSVGDRVEVEGAYDEDGVLIAAEIEREDGD